MNIMASVRIFKIKLYVYSALNRDTGIQFAYIDGQKETSICNVFLINVCTLEVGEYILKYVDGVLTMPFMSSIRKQLVT
jgi:hypothetical protein